jgi:HlyD family secretion protein
MTRDLKALENLKIDRPEHDHDAGAPHRRWLVVAAVAIAVTVGAGWYLARGARAVEVETAQVTEAAGGGGPAAVLNASGYVTARRQATVSSKVTGKVVEVLVEEGMRVEEGQVLARLDDSEARLALELAEARHAAVSKAVAETEARRREADLRHERVRGLRSQGIVSQADLDALVAEVEALAARLAAQREETRAAGREAALARQVLADLVIRAPFAGVAISKDAQPGEMISPISAGGGFTRTGISTIVDMSSLEIEVDVNEAYIQRVTPGQRVTATLDAYPDWPIPARVITTIPAAERDKATVKVRIGFDQLDPRLLPDMGVKVAFLGEPAAAAAASSVRVPRAALRGEAGAEHVWVVAGERLERRAVRLGPGGSDPAEVVAGLAAGERVVVRGPAELAAGTRVVERKTN